MVISEVHQFTVSCTTGDGISNGVFFVQKLLRELGYKSHIYSVDIENDLKNQVHEYKQYNSNPDQLLLVHHGWGHGFEDWLRQLPVNKVMIYHNITPPEYFSSRSMQAGLLLAREQMQRWKEFMCGAISDSAYNTTELIAAGWRPEVVRTIPLLVDIESMQKRALVAEKEGNPPFNGKTLLFVGQMLPHKGQLDLVDCFYYLCQLYDFPVRLVLIGGGEPGRLAELRQRVVELGLDQSVLVLGKVSDAELLGWYEVADLYVSMSEHEGFGMPLIEAGVFDVPVLAYNTAAVAETVGPGGILFSEKDFPRCAALIGLLLKDESLRERIIIGQRQNNARFDRELLKTKLNNFILLCA